MIIPQHHQLLEGFLSTALDLINRFPPAAAAAVVVVVVENYSRTISNGRIDLALLSLPALPPAHYLSW